MQAFFEAWYGQVITAIVAVLLILVGIGIVAGKKKNRRQATRMLVFSTAAIALATVLSFLKIVELPPGRFYHLVQYVRHHLDRLFLRTGTGNSVWHGVWFDSADPGSLCDSSGAARHRLSTGVWYAGPFRLSE